MTSKAPFKPGFIMCYTVLVIMLSSCSDGSSTTCCKVCKTGKPCGDSCISITDECTLPTGCACNNAGVVLSGISNDSSVPLVGVSHITAGMKDVQYVSGGEAGDVGKDGAFTYEIGQNIDFYYQEKIFMTITHEEVVVEE